MNYCRGAPYLRLDRPQAEGCARGEDQPIDIRFSLRFGQGEVELGGWRVRPSLNRLERDGSTVRLEPKMMDVLAALARRAGEVVSKDELSAAVWPDVFVTDSVITRAIAGLRRALEDYQFRETVFETYD